MTELEKKIEQLEIRIEELEAETDDDWFCGGCEFITIEADAEEFWGVRCYHEYPVCPGEFYPSSPSCPRYDEYERAYKELLAVREELKNLDEEWEKDNA